MSNPKIKPISLRQTLLVRLSLFVTGTALLVCLGFIILGLLPVIDKIAEKEFNSAANNVAADLNALFNPTHALLKMSSEWIGDQAPDLNLPDHFNSYFQPLLKQIPQITSVVAGTTSGKGWLLLQQTDGIWRNRMTDAERWGNQHLLIRHHPDGSSTQEWNQLDYDVRKRPWFISALNNPIKQTVNWTAPYVFYSTRDPGITASIQKVLRNGDQLILGFDLTLRDLSNFTMQSKVGKQGMALVLTDSELVLALPPNPEIVDNTEWLKRVLHPAANLGIPAISDALKGWHETGRKPNDALSFNSEKRRWLASVHPYALGNQKFWVITMAPANDFAPNWLPFVMLLTGGLVVLLAIAFLIARKQAFAIASPLERLAAVSQRIGQLDFADIPAVTSNIKEIQQLVSTQDNMRKTLQQNQHALAEQSDRLQHQVDALQQAKTNLRESNAYNKVLFSESRIPLLVLEPNTEIIVDCNLAAARIFHLADRESLLNKHFVDISSPTQYDGFDSSESAKGHIKLAQLKGSHLFEWRYTYLDGKYWDAEVHLMDFAFESRPLLQASLLDITDRRATADEINKLAFYDTLTRLPNRRLFLDRLQQTLSGSRKGHEGALLITRIRIISA